MIVCDAVSVRSSPEAGAIALLDNVSFEARQGTVTVIRGASGSGKSTLLSVLACVRRPTSGEVRFHGKPVSRYTAAHRDKLRRTIGFLPQQLHLFDELTAVENVSIPLMAAGVTRAEGAARAIDLLRRLQIDHASMRPVRSLSGGERQRVALARALVIDAPVVILDEPTAHQDDRRVSIMLSLIDEMKNRGRVVVVASHDSRLDAWGAVDDVLRLEGGRLAGEGG